MTLWTTGEVIQRVVKRDIPLSEQDSIATLNDLPGWMVEEAREIARESRVGAVRYLRFYVAAHRSSSAEDFVEDVLQNGQAAATWRIRDALFVPHEPRHIIEVAVDRYVDGLAAVDGERWFRMRPKGAEHLSDYLPGMVGIVQRQTRYWHVTPDRITRCPLALAADVEAVDPAQLHGSIRRWIARRLAWWARAYLEQHRGHATCDGIIASASEPGGPEATADARVAATALAREAATHGDSTAFPLRAGFLGPDVWYQPVDPRGGVET
jgi:hypothetical protein